MSIDYLNVYKMIVAITFIYVSWICYYYPEQYRKIQESILKNKELNLN